MKVSSSFRKRWFANLLTIPACLLCSFLPVPVHAAIIGHWLFNEGAGNIALDSSSEGNHGSIFGGAPYVATPGATGISLDGIDDFVNFGQPAIFDFTSDEFSVEVWVAIDGSQSGDNHGIFG